ncbi:HAMP domain-containing histidine kinase [Microbacterium sp. 4R-513]|uniref:sensor histidine kinase n=1 Tax=Microbacterium sp. 4R-513 TaxID=2567934 RepID=UPI0013E10200|nr:HAMP domain-containing sensor histidine kinase [Microbacterium sp. 4R-513]QIG40187.1 HAMP domain-containing histidine kinase [Microbacterium sp. 4R-513]
MVTITAIVALILVGVAVAISAFLGQILQENLNAKVQETATITGQNILRLEAGPGGDQDLTAYDVLTAGRQEEGVLLVTRGPDDPAATGAVVASDGTVKALTGAQVDAIGDGIQRPGLYTVSVDGLGEYRVYADQLPNQTVAVIGLPLSEVQKTVAQLFSAILIVTAAGLVLLGVAIALVVRAGLRPLRAVADTATRVAALPMSEGSVTIEERVPEEEADDRTEIGRVGHALNTLLDHVDSSLDARQRNEERMRRFVADASHELRTPLASIRGYSELSLRALRQAEASGISEPVTIETTGQSLERIQAQSLRMTTLVEDLLLLARLDEGQELVYGSVDLTKLAIEAVEDARPAGPEHEWVLEVGEEPVVIAGDSGRLHQVAANLLANARAHTPAGTTVTTTVLRDGKDAVLRVHDDGPGVDPAIKAELFERFARADRSRARKTGGTGLGLSIARAIVAAHGGIITVASEPGDTTFEVRLPARPADPAAG